MRRDCGLNASITIEPLIRMQYSFDFLPPCEKTSLDSCPDSVRSSGVSGKFCCTKMLFILSQVFVYFLVMIIRNNIEITLIL